MPTIHFLNVLEGDCNIIQHDSGRLTVIDVSNAFNDEDTEEEKKSKNSKEREERRKRTQVPSGKIDYKQKLEPDNPIKYIHDHLRLNDIYRFIITHPDMDHLDGIKDLYTEFSITNTWDTNNNKEKQPNDSFAGYNKEDWEFYNNLRSGKYSDTKRLTFYDSDNCLYWNQDDIKVLAPSPDLIKSANSSPANLHDACYVILFTPPKKGGGRWRIIFSGDSHDNSWKHIISNYAKEVSNIDVLIAPHHGRDSNRDYSFLDVLKPKVTLFGNADSCHLAYNCYPKTRITNNQAGYIIMDIKEDSLVFYVKNYEFAKNYMHEKGFGTPSFNSKFKAYGLFQFSA